MPYSLRPHFVPSTILRLLQLFSQLTRLTLQLDSICANAILKILASGITVVSVPLRSMIENRSTPSPSSKSMASIAPFDPFVYTSLVFEISSLKLMPDISRVCSPILTFPPALASTDGSSLCSPFISTSSTSQDYTMVLMVFRADLDNTTIL